MIANNSLNNIKTLSVCSKSDSQSSSLQPAGFCHNSKYCPNCKQVKPLSEFYKDIYRPDGLQSWCNTCQKTYRQSQKGKKVHQRGNRKYYLRYPEKIKAHTVTNQAIGFGQLPPPRDKICSICRHQAEHYHHPDYSKPFDIVALCRKCHRKIHKTLCRGEKMNGYIGFYKGKKFEALAETSRQAQQKIATENKIKKAYEITVMIAEKEGEQVTHIAEQ